MSVVNTSLNPAAIKAMPKKSFLVQKLVAWVLLISLLFIMLFPLAIIVSNSFKTEDEYRQTGPLALPLGLNLAALTRTWDLMDYPLKLGNSLIISVGAATLGVIISLLNGFALGVGKIKGRMLFLLFFIMAMTLPGEVLIYPLYYGFKAIKMYDNIWAVVIIFGVLHSAYGTYLLTSVFSQFTKEMVEAAEIDGASKLQILTMIVVPLTLPSLSVLFVFFFIWTFNDFFFSLIFLISNANQTVPLAMALARSDRGVVITIQSAAAVLGILPCLIFFILFQRTLTSGITMGAVK
jgi:raffinose/stachyose/melibiose transport system permease protein